MLSNKTRPQYHNHVYNSPNLLTDTKQNMPALRGLDAQNAGLTDRKPSKLEQLRADYQKKLIKEKEEKIIQMYDENQRKTMMKLNRKGSGNVQANSMVGSPSGGKSVREFFNERRRREANGLRVAPIDNHYRQAKVPNSPGGWSSRTGSGNSLYTQQKSICGRDRSKLLAPIQRPVETQGLANNNNNVPLGRPERPSHDLGIQNPFQGKPRLVKHRPLPPTSNRPTTGNNSSSTTTNDSFSGNQATPKCTPQARWPHPPAQKPNPNTSGRSRYGGSGDRTQADGTEKLTDYQKWQLEQNKAREERLKKIYSDKSDNDGVWDPPEDAAGDKCALEIESEHKKEEEEVNANVRKGQGEAKERELLQKIAKHQKELERMKKERQREEEQEKREMERSQKKEDREGQRKLEEEAQQEEEPTEEVRMKKEKVEEERRKRQTEKQLKEEDDNREKEREKCQKEENKFSDADSPLPCTGGTSNTFEAGQEKAGISDVSLYMQAAMSSEAKGSIARTAACNICGRYFADDRLQKHQQACKVANKPRKTFDAAKKRMEGTEMARYVAKAKRLEPQQQLQQQQKKKSNWRVQHQNFIQSLRYAKKATQYEKEGRDVRDLTPPPATDNPDLVPCPNCGRTFHETAAQRHIPRCKELKTRPAPTRRKLH